MTVEHFSEQAFVAESLGSRTYLGGEVGPSVSACPACLFSIAAMRAFASVIRSASGSFRYER